MVCVAQVLHPLAMQPAIRSGKMGVRVKNSYNRQAEGTIIASKRDMSSTLVTSIVLKNSVTLVDIVSTRMLGQFGFLAMVFDVFRRNKVKPGWQYMEDFCMCCVSILLC